MPHILSLPKKLSHIAVYYYLGNKSNDKIHLEINGDIRIECKTNRHVVASYDEVETGGGHNYQIDIPIQVKLEAINHHQTPIKNDDTTATGFVYKNSNNK